MQEQLLPHLSIFGIRVTPPIQSAEDATQRTETITISA
jgi:hypothetical protein